MPETFTPKTWFDGSAGGTPIIATELNRIEVGIESMDDRTAALELVSAGLLGDPSGDTTGATDTATIRAAIAAAAAAGGGIVQARPGKVYQVVSTTTQTVLHPSGSSASRAVCITIPTGVRLDMRGSTLQLRGSTEAIIVANTHTDNTARDTDLGLINAVLDGRNIAATTMSMMHLAYVDRLALSNVKIINGQYQGAWIYDCTTSYFNQLDCDGFVGQPWTLGSPLATGTGHNQIYDSTFGALLGRNVTLLNTGSQPGNPYNLVLTRCTIESIQVRTCSAGVKLQQPSVDVAVGSVIVDTCGEATALNSGFKIQGDSTYPAGTDRPTRIRVGRVIATNQANNGLYLAHTQDCAIESYIGRNNVLLHTANSDVFLTGGIRDYIGRVDVIDSNGGGVRINDVSSAGPTGYYLPTVRVTNCGKGASATIKSAVRVDVASEGAFGRVVAIDDQGTHTMSRGLDVTHASAVGTVASFVATGFTDVAFASAAAGFDNPGNIPGSLATGEETILRDLATSGNPTTATQLLKLSYFTARKTELTTTVRVISGGTAAAATPTLARIGLYTIDSTGAGALVASTANDTALFAATSTVYTKSWSSSYLKVAGQRYAVAILVVTAVQAPNLGGASITTSAEATLAPRTTGQIASQSDLPSTFTGASVAASLGRFYAALA